MPLLEPSNAVGSRFSQPILVRAFLSHYTCSSLLSPSTICMNNMRNRKRPAQTFLTWLIHKLTRTRLHSDTRRPSGKHSRCPRARGRQSQHVATAPLNKLMIDARDKGCDLQKQAFACRSALGKIGHCPGKRTFMRRSSGRQEAAYVGRHHRCPPSHEQVGFAGVTDGYNKGAAAITC